MILWPTYPQDFRSRLFHNSFIYALALGNISAEEAEKLINYAADRLISVPLALPSLFPDPRVVLLPKGTHTVTCPNRNPEDDNSVVHLYYQFPEWGYSPSVSFPRAVAICDLIEQLMSEPCFNFLRTQLQLGYDVSSR